MYRLIIFVLTVSIVVTGCSLFGQKPAPQAQPEAPPPKTDEQKEPQTKEYTVGLQSPVKGIDKWVDRYNRYEGIFLQRQGNNRLLLISMGEKFVPGYKLILDEVRKSEDKWIVRVSFREEQAPPDAEPTTYIPWEVVTLPADDRTVEVVEKSNTNAPRELKLIEIPEGKELPASKSFIIFSPLEGAQIKNPAVISGKARVFEANFNILIKEGTSVLASEVVMAREGAPGWGEFELNLPFQTPVTSDLVVIFAYENMENGELIQELTVPVVFAK